MNTLQALRRYFYTEDGIFLVFHSRYDTSADIVCRLIVAAGGSVIERRKSGKMRTGHDKTHKVVFTIGVAEDQYLARRINAAGMVAMKMALKEGA